MNCKYCGSTRRQCPLWYPFSIGISSLSINWLFYRVGYADPFFHHIRDTAVIKLGKRRFTFQGIPYDVAEWHQERWDTICDKAMKVRMLHCELKWEIPDK